MSTLRNACRCCSPTQEEALPEPVEGRRGILVVTAGDPSRLTGGYIYCRRMLEALQRARQSVEQLVLPEHPVLRAASMLEAAVAERRPELLIIDSIALRPADRMFGRLRGTPAPRLLVLMHMLPSALAPPVQRPRVRAA